ncbi:MAG: SH3 domain-containing protein [Pseudomonadota bacterium]
MKKNIKRLLLLGLTYPILSLAGDAGTALKADTLRAEPFADAKSVGTLAKNDAVDIVNKKGAWLQVKSKKSTGWVRLLSVKRGAATQTNQAGGIAAVASGRAGTGKVVSTTGIRGLSAEELKAAQFNEAEMKKLESYETTSSDGKQFASAGGLNATSIAYLKGAK